MAENFSVERRKIMKMLGAKVVLTPASEKGTGMVKKAEGPARSISRSFPTSAVSRETRTRVAEFVPELAAKHGWFLTRQFQNPANPAYHRQTTASGACVSILLDFTGRSLDYFVTGWGTGGTLSGVSTVLRAARPDVKIVACEPSKAALLSGNEFQPHMIQGWTPNFVPEVLDRASYDTLLQIDDEEAIRVTMDLARKEGILSGISGGATVRGALEVAKTAPPGSAILAMLPDTGERYMSTPLFAKITDSSDEA
ncbi:MAG: tryptophan synthase beta subunit-like PLP-dependent enzyme [Olpidium bornovanus]|uniref:Tryptophan synthase beta subunit-like PLP-dependent enzyme n=1 Tax=Olpidium bornovanus TaxID=278681 RepID=A0A8H8DH53_9FUNG|nr:MAG: tryptophan synthase beta subunit-like PLP-dependent enzyme [Olpidium bornovanus]